VILVRHFRKNRRNIGKLKLINLKLTVRSKISDLYRSIFKKDYKPRTNIVKDERSDLVTDSHSILARWRNHFSQLLNVHGVNDVRQTEIQTAESLVPESSALSLRWLLNS
jgi:hypothetical protein